MMIKGWEEFFEQNKEVLARIGRTLKKSKLEVLPKKKNVFRMFRLMEPKDIKVVIVCKAPYETECALTGIAFASGVALMPALGCVVEPVDAVVVARRVAKEYDVERPNLEEMFKQWISEGVFLINVAFTVGVGCDKFLANHKVVWEEFTRNVLRYIYLQKGGKVVTILMGKDAISLSDCVGSKYLIKVPSIVEKDGQEKGSEDNKIFIKANEMLVYEMGVLPVVWYP